MFGDVVEGLTIRNLGRPVSGNKIRDCSKSTFDWFCWLEIKVKPIFFIELAHLILIFSIFMVSFIKSIYLIAKISSNSKLMASTNSFAFTGSLVFGIITWPLLSPLRNRSTSVHFWCQGVWYRFGLGINKVLFCFQCKHVHGNSCSSPHVLLPIFEIFNCKWLTFYI